MSNHPEHIAIIMDGNGRWASAQNLERTEGHKKGVESVWEVVQAAQDNNIKYLTLYSFSSENWNRPAAEVQAIMSLLQHVLEKETDRLHDNKIKFKIIGERYLLPEKINHDIAEIERKTQNYDGLCLILALSYGARMEIFSAVSDIVHKVQSGELDAKDLNEKIVASHLYTSDIPDPDLLIRTGGEYRVSNFLLWQIAYSELYFTDILWPDFGKDELNDAITEYKNRERRFGLTSEQL